MDSEDTPKPENADSFISFRLHGDDKELVLKAAAQAGLRLSSFFILLLVRCKILPQSRLINIKRKPAVTYKALHSLLSVVNKTSGLCKQISVHLPNIPIMDGTKEKLIQAAAAITDCLRGKPVSEDVNLYLYQVQLTKLGYILNEVAKYLNSGKSDVEGLERPLLFIEDVAGRIAFGLGGRTESEALTDMAMDEMRAKMRMAAAELTQPKEKDEDEE